jgi:hypothetical protein
MTPALARLVEVLRSAPPGADPLTHQPGRLAEALRAVALEVRPDAPVARAGFLCYPQCGSLRKTQKG